MGRKKSELSEVMQELPNNQNCEELFFSQWRQAPVVRLCKDSKEGEVNLYSLKAPNNHTCIFSNEVGVEALHHFKVNNPDVQKDEHNGCAPTRDTIVSLERFDKFFVTFVSCLCDDGWDIVGGPRQKLYHDAFKDALLKACRLLIQKVRQ